MTSERSRQKLLEFMDYLGDKGLMPQATVSSRKAAVSKVLGILDEDEAADVMALDLDDVMKRFNNKEGKSYTPGSLSTYLSRLKSAVDDFRTYLENPLGFKPNSPSRERRKPEGKKENSATYADTPPNVERHVVKAPLANTILPIPIRADVTVLVQGIPFDLTEAEANKIANVIRAMATPA